MKIVTLSESYLQEQFLNSVQRAVKLHLSDREKNIHVLPRSVEVLTKRVLAGHALNGTGIFNTGTHNIC